MTGDMFPAAVPADVRTEDKIRELERELAMRRHLYPKWVQQGKLQQQEAHRQIITLEAILEDYKHLQERS